MVRTTGRRARAVARVVAYIAPAVVGLGLANACNELRGSLGDDCLKSHDCQSGICSELHCAPQPPLLDAAYVPPGDANADALAEASGGDGAAVAPPDASTASDDAAPDASEPPPDTGTVPPGDAAEDVVDGGHSDVETDGPIDAIAVADAGEAG
jgi:hypothetical protein